MTRHYAPIRGRLRRALLLLRDHDGRSVRAELEAALVLCPALDGPVADVARDLLRDSDRLSAVELSAIARCSEREAKAVLAALRAA